MRINQDNARIVDQILNAEEHWGWIPPIIEEMLETRRSEVEKIREIEGVEAMEGLQSVIDRICCYQMEMDLLNLDAGYIREMDGGLPPRQLWTGIECRENDLMEECDSDIRLHFNRLFELVGANKKAELSPLEMEKTEEIRSLLDSKIGCQEASFKEMLRSILGNAISDELLKLNDQDLPGDLRQLYNRFVGFDVQLHKFDENEITNEDAANFLDREWRGVMNELADWVGSSLSKSGWGVITTTANKQLSWLDQTAKVTE